MRWEEGFLIVMLSIQLATFRIPERCRWGLKKNRVVFEKYRLCAAVHFIINKWCGPFFALKRLFQHLPSIFVFGLTGSGQYIYVHESQSSLPNRPAQLLSPLIRGPKCLRFYYYMNGSDIGNLDVLLWPQEQQGNYLIWRRSGEQDDVWLKASVDVGYTGESRVGREQMSIRAV